MNKTKQTERNIGGETNRIEISILAAQKWGHDCIDQFPFLSLPWLRNV